MSFIRNFSRICCGNPSEDLSVFLAFFRNCFGNFSKSSVENSPGVSSLEIPPARRFRSIVVCFSEIPSFDNFSRSMLGNSSLKITPELFQEFFRGFFFGNLLRSSFGNVSRRSLGNIFRNSVDNSPGFVFEFFRDFFPGIFGIRQAVNLEKHIRDSFVTFQGIFREFLQE